MKCPLSGKECDAPKNFLINEVVNGKKQTLSLCQSCAAQYLTNPSVQKEFLNHNKERTQKIEELRGMIEDVPKKEQPEPLTPSQMIRNLLEKVGGKQQPKPQVKTAKPLPSCPGCGSTAADIEKSKKLGCMECFDFFGKSILNVLNKIHRSTTHTGKVPKRWQAEQAKAIAKKESLAKKKIPVEETIGELENMLKAAVRKEDYDQAAQVRDQLNAIQPLQEERLKLNQELKEACDKEDLERAAVLKQRIIEIMKEINSHR